MLILETILLLLYFLAQALEIASGAISLVARYDVVLFAAAALALVTIGFFAAKKWPIIKSANKTALIIGHLMLYGAIFVSYNKFETHYADMGTSIYGTTFSVSFMNTAIVFAIAVVSAFCIPAMMNAPFMKKYFNKKYLIGLGCISAYTAFAVLGDSLFFQYDLSLVTLTVYLLGVLWVFPITLQVLALYELIVMRMGRKQVHPATRTRSNRFVWLTTFAIFVGIWLIYLIAYNPAQMSPDSVSMWYRATSGERIASLGVPTLDILFIRLLAYIIPHPMIIPVVQILLFAVLCAFFMLEFYKHGIPLRVVYIFAGVFAALPPNGLMITTIWSNIPYTLAMLYLAYGIFKLFALDRGRIVPYVNVALALTLTYSTRHEGFVPAIVCAAFFFILSVKHLKASFNRKLLAAMAVGGLLIFLTQGPFYKATQTETAKSPTGKGMLLDGLHHVVYYGGNLSEETLAFMESMMSLEVWRSEYSVYDMRGLLSPAFYEAYIEGVGPRASQPGFTAELFGHYLNTLTREPFMLIQNRLANSNLVWGITQPKGSYNERCMTWTQSDGIGFPHKNNPIETIISKLIYPVSIAFAPLDVLLYRGGVYVILSLLLCVFLISRKAFHISLPLLPLVGGVVALMLAMSWPCFRVIWFMPVIFMLTVPLILVQVAGDSEPEITNNISKGSLK